MTMASAAGTMPCPCWDSNLPCPLHRQQPTTGRRFDMPLAVDITLEYELDLSQFRGLDAEGNADPAQPMLLVAQPPRPQMTYAQRRYLVARRSLAAASPVGSWQQAPSTHQTLSWHPATPRTHVLPYQQQALETTQYYHTGVSAHVVPSFHASVAPQPADVAATCSVCRQYPSGASVPLHHLPRTPAEGVPSTVKRKYTATFEEDLIYPSKRTAWDYLRHFGQLGGATSWQQLVTAPQACRAY